MITALLMGIAVKDGAPMSDAEIKAKALTLGMVESDSLKLSDVGNINPTSEPVETSTPDTSAEPAGTSTPDTSAEPAGTSTPDSSAKPAGSSAASSNVGSTGSDASNMDTAPANGTHITIVIESGEIASEISRKIAEAGLVEDAAVFERYLCEIGCTRSIWDGTYTIPVGTSMEEIAKIIARLE